MPSTIKSGKNYELQACLTPIDYWPGTYSFELHQCFPEAQRPRWQRLVQLNLNEAEISNLVTALTNR